MHMIDVIKEVKNYIYVLTWGTNTLGVKQTPTSYTLHMVVQVASIKLELSHSKTHKLQKNSLAH